MEKDNIIIEEIQFTEEAYLKNIQQNDFPEPDDGIGGDKNEDN